MEVALIKLAPEDVDTHIKSAIINSAIGEQLSKAIQEKLKDLRLDPTIKKVVEEEIPKILREILSEPERKEQLRALIREQLTDKVLLEVINKSVQHLLFN